MNSKKIIECYKQITLTRDELLSMVDAEEMKSIKNIDADAMIVAYIVAHEGISKPVVIGEGTKAIKWDKDAVRTVSDKLEVGMPVYDSHPKPEGRNQVGHIVGYKEKMIDGVLSTIFAAYIKPEYADQIKSYDISSMEAIWKVVETVSGMISKGVSEITGIALGSRKKGEKPGFSRADKLLSITAYDTEVSIYAFEEQREENKNMDWNSINPAEIPFEILRAGVKAKKIYLSQIYDPEELLPKKITNGDKESYESYDREFTKSFNKFAEQIRNEVTDKYKDYDDVKKERDALKKELTVTVNKPKVIEIAKTKYSFNDAAIKFLNRELKDFSDFDSDDKINEFVDSVKKDYEEIFGEMKAASTPKSQDQSQRVSLGPQDAQPTNETTLGANIKDEDIQL